MDFIQNLMAVSWIWNVHVWMKWIYMKEICMQHLCTTTANSVRKIILLFNYIEFMPRNITKKLICFLLDIFDQQWSQN